MSLDRGRELSSRARLLNEVSNDLRKASHDLIRQSQALRRGSKRNPDPRFERDSKGATRLSREPLPQSAD
jgi:hypothetical protein